MSGRRTLWSSRIRKVKARDQDGKSTVEGREVTESIIDRAGRKQRTSVLKELQSIKAELNGPDNPEETGVIILAERAQGA